MKTKLKAVEDYYPGYAETYTRIGKERAWPPVTGDRFDAQRGPTEAYVIGNPEEVAAKIIRNSEEFQGLPFRWTMRVCPILNYLRQLN
jgi:hypothetical protein